MSPHILPFFILTGLVGCSLFDTSLFLYFYLLPQGVTISVSKHTLLPLLYLALIFFVILYNVPCSILAAAPFAFGIRLFICSPLSRLYFHFTSLSSLRYSSMYCAAIPVDPVLFIICLAFLHFFVLMCPHSSSLNYFPFFLHLPLQSH